MRATRFRFGAAASIVAALLLAACGSGSKSSSSAAASPPASSTTRASSTSATSSTAAKSAAPVVVSTKRTKLGTILAAGSKHLTVYLFEADKGSRSSCMGACAGVWPPVTGKPHAAGAAKSAELGTITRPDGTTQVTYKGHPLYFYAKDVEDGDAGDTYGEAIKSFGAEWYVLAPSGNKVDVS